MDLGEYTPPAEILERYAELLVGFALNGGRGIDRGEVVVVQANEVAKPLYAALCRAVWRAGGNVLARYTPSDDAVARTSRDFLELATDAQLDFFAKSYYDGLVAQADHLVAIRAEADPHALKGIEPSKLIRRQRALQPYIAQRRAKEAVGRFSWTLAVYGTAGMAREAGMSAEEYWQQIIAGCQLAHEDPAARWREIFAAIRGNCAKLDALEIDRLHVRGEDVDLRLTLGERRRWLGGTGHNIPSYEVFCSPDWRGTEGWIRFNQPLYRYGSLIKGIELRFEQGRVVHACATDNERLLQGMIAAPGADRVGEFSMTDGRLSQITRFMADTLFDENAGGRYGNTHVALGRAYLEGFAGDPAAPSKQEWAALGFNDSAIHTDIVSTADRTVTATLADGAERVIYADGRFQLD